MEQRRFCGMPAENLLLVFCDNAGCFKPMFSIFLQPGSFFELSDVSLCLECQHPCGLQRLKPSLPDVSSVVTAKGSSSAWGACACWGMTPNFGTLIPVLQELSQLEAAACASLAVAVCNGRMSLFYKVGQLGGIPRVEGLLIPQHFQGLLLFCYLLWRNWALAFLPGNV